MNGLAKLAQLTGNWQGPNRLWLNPAEPFEESHATATVAPVAQGKFVTLLYTWEQGGHPADGLIVIGFNPSGGDVDVYWIDSWHMGANYMLLKGQTLAEGGIAVKGSYPAPDGPDWGWRIEIKPGQNEFHMLMYNIMPLGDEMLAVQATFTPRP